ncbi:hypothetical protein AAC387_Pa05g0820 [Persea americana]
MCQEQKNQFETLKDLCQIQQETIRAYDETFARFDAVISAYMQGGLVGEGSNSRQTFCLYNVEHSYEEHSGNETFEDVVVYKEPSTYDNLLMTLGSSSKSMADVHQRRSYIEDTAPHRSCTETILFAARTRRWLGESDDPDSLSLLAGEKRRRGWALDLPCSVGAGEIRRRRYSLQCFC